MKNVHLIPTEKPSRLYKQTGALVLDKLSEVSNDGISINQHLYITSDEEIKEGDWVIAIEGIWKNTITKITGTPITDVWMKIILTTDPDLLGVQSIDNEFLEWFVKNPSCEEVEVELFPKFSNKLHGLVIPKEEPKQETTAVQFLYDQIWKTPIAEWHELLHQAKAMEKEQIIMAHCHNRCLNNKTYECSIKAFENSEHYYNETFKTKEK